MIDPTANTSPTSKRRRRLNRPFQEPTLPFSTPKIEKHVTFAASPEIKYIERWSCNKEDLWYTEKDREAFIAEKDKDVNMIKVLRRIIVKTNYAPKSIEYARMRLADTEVMGLENEINVGAVSKREIKLRSKIHSGAVMLEQWEQRRKEMAEDQDAIASVSMEKSERSRERAQVIGTLHAADDCISSILLDHQQLEVKIVRSERRRSLQEKELRREKARERAQTMGALRAVKDSVSSILLEKQVTKYLEKHQLMKKGRLSRTTVAA